VEEGYAAYYLQSETDVIAVHALKFGPNEGSSHPTNRRLSPATRIDLGAIVAVVSGRDGPCFQAIEAYVKSLAR
jgi:hypothetical protein